MFGLTLARPEQPLADAWRRVAVRPRNSTLLGITFRPRQAEAFGLDARAALDALLAYPFDLIRLAAYWDRVEPRSGQFDTHELDWQLAAAERAGKAVIVSVGPIKNFGYPELYAPQHRLDPPLREGSVIRPETHSALAAAATRVISSLVTRYRDRSSVVAWQLEHEAVDPLGFEHSWRLARDFVAAELAALREADASRPVMMNGFLPASALVQLPQWWRTRDQGDSLAVASELADIVGIDYYPRHALVRVGPRTLYVDGSRRPPPAALLRTVQARSKRWMVAEGQAEPWETTVTPPNPAHHAMFTCGPQHVIENYNAAMSWSDHVTRPYGYLLWGAEYWLFRSQSGDESYLGAFARLLEEA